MSDNPLNQLRFNVLISSLYNQIESNWIESNETYNKPASRQNWRFTKQLSIAKNNNSPEVTLERKIVEITDETWANQIPTSSGLTGPYTDKVRNIDLIKKNDAGSYQFIELKIDSNTPLYASMEILCYGILYLFSRKNIDLLGYDINEKELLRAEDIYLRTLAPYDYYKDYDLEWLANSINTGLSLFLDVLNIPNIRMDFSFDSFPKNFIWPLPDEVSNTDSAVKDALSNSFSLYDS